MYLSIVNLLIIRSVVALPELSLVFVVAFSIVGFGHPTVVE